MHITCKEDCEETNKGGGETGTNTVNVWWCGSLPGIRPCGRFILLYISYQNKTGTDKCFSQVVCWEASEGVRCVLPPRLTCSMWTARWRPLEWIKRLLFWRDVRGGTLPARLLGVETSGGALEGEEEGLRSPRGVHGLSRWPSCCSEERKLQKIYIKITRRKYCKVMPRLRRTRGSEAGEASCMLLSINVLIS